MKTPTKKSNWKPNDTQELLLRAGTRIIKQIQGTDYKLAMQPCPTCSTQTCPLCIKSNEVFPTGENASENGLSSAVCYMCKRESQEKVQTKFRRHSPEFMCENGL